jgi:hypothetical protein
MSKEKVTLTLESDNLRALRAMVGSRSLSETVDAAVAVHIARLRHAKQVDEWLAEMEDEHGPVPPQTLEWAARMVNDWESRSRKRPKKVG